MALSQVARSECACYFNSAEICLAVTEDSGEKEKERDLIQIG